MSGGVHFLERVPFDWSYPESQALLRILLAAYPSQPEALATAVGVDPSEIALHPKLRLTWMALVDEARLEEKLRPMLEAVINDRNKAAIHERLRLVLTAHHNLVDLQNGEEKAQEVRAWFDYEIDLAGQLCQVLDIAAEPASVVGSREEDWAAIKLSRAPGDPIDQTSLSPTDG